MFYGQQSIGVASGMGKVLINVFLFGEILTPLSTDCRDFHCNASFINNY